MLALFAARVSAPGTGAPKARSRGLGHEEIRSHTGIADGRRASQRLARDRKADIDRAVERWLSG